MSCCSSILFWWLQLAPHNMPSSGRSGGAAKRGRSRSRGPREAGQSGGPIADFLGGEAAPSTSPGIREASQSGGPIEGFLGGEVAPSTSPRDPRETICIFRCPVFLSTGQCVNSLYVFPDPKGCTECGRPRVAQVVPRHTWPIDRFSKFQRLLTVSSLR